MIDRSSIWPTVDGMDVTGTQKTAAVGPQRSFSFVCMPRCGFTDLAVRADRSTFTSATTEARDRADNHWGDCNPGGDWRGQSKPSRRAFETVQFWPRSLQRATAFAKKAEKPHRVAQATVPYQS